MRSIRQARVARLSLRGFGTYTSWNPNKGKGQKAEEEQKKCERPQLKQTLRKFYLKVHPDLFGQYPDAKKINEENLAVLSAILDGLKSESSSTGLEGRDHTVEFYLKPDFDGEQSKNQKLEKIKTVFPFRNTGSMWFSKQVYAGLRSLFSQSRLESDFIPVNETVSGSSRHALTLMEFLMQVRQDALKTLMDARKKRMNYQLLLVSMRMQGLRFLWEGDIDENEEQKESTLEKFKRVLDGVGWCPDPEGPPEDEAYQEREFKSPWHIADNAHAWYDRQVELGLMPPREELTRERIRDLGGGGALFGRAFGGGLKGQQKTSPLWEAGQDCVGDFIMRYNRQISDSDARLPLARTVTVFRDTLGGTRVDERGRLVFSTKDTEAEWMEFLNGDISKLVEARQHAWKVTKELEAQACEAVSLHDIYCEPCLLTNPSYVGFMDRLREGKENMLTFIKNRPKMSKLSLRVHAGGDHPAYSVDQNMGFLNIPVDATVNQLLDFIRENGELALWVQEEYHQRTQVSIGKAELLPHLESVLNSVFS